MGIHVVIADPRPLFRDRLHDLFAREPAIASITEATTMEELTEQLQVSVEMFVIVHQSLIKDMSLLPSHQFVLIATLPDKTMFLEALEHGACGYVLENARGMLIAGALKVREGQCLLDPQITPWIARLLNEKEHVPSDKGLLTKRQREVLALKEQHVSNKEIADRLCISERTVNKHIENINHKRSME
jgi:DNA-binding NarL/FixJ family response regulator